MPLKTNIGVNRKVADNNYGSRGCSVNLEVELDSSLIQEPERLQERIRQVFRLAQQAVDEELSRQNTANGHAQAGSGNGQPTENGRHNGNGNGHRRAGGRKATASQVRAIHAIASRQGLDLAAALHERYGIDRPEDLAITEASETIDSLKAQANGAGARG